MELTRDFVSLPSTMCSRRSQQRKQAPLLILEVTSAVVALAAVVEAVERGAKHSPSKPSWKLAEVEGEAVLREELSCRMMKLL